MSDHAAFLNAVLERPDDDLPRLVYADYLDETGEPNRAEFIRVQIELARLALAAGPRGGRSSGREDQNPGDHRRP